jgi:hypothetical protein
MVRTARAGAARVFDLLPLTLFFLYLLFVVITFHGREIVMLDYTPTFDHWWYFYHRLRDGALAQWNPFSLLGRIAVQWHYLPVSILSPLMLLSDLTLARFHALHVLGTTLVLIALYAAGRIAGYGATLPLLGIVLVAATGFRYWMSFLHFATLLTVFPLLIAWLVSRADRHALLSAREIAGLGLGLALAFLGLRLELMIYAVTLVLLGFLALAWADPQGRRAGWVLSGVAVVSLAIAASAWQLAFLVASTLESQRGAITMSPGRLLDGEVIRWLLAGMALQPALLLLLLNLGLQLLCRVAPRLSRIPVGAPTFVALIVLQCTAGWALARIGQAMARSLAPALSVGDGQGGFDIIAAPTGLAALVLAGLAVRRADAAPDLPRLLTAAAVFSAGALVSSYTGRTWIVNTSVHPYFVPLPLTGFLALGAVGLWLRGRTWVVVTLTAYHLVGEIGSLALYESVGLPWFPPRAALVELPFQLMLMLEGGRIAVGLVAAGLEHLGAGSFLRSSVATRVGGIAVLVLAAILLHRALLPTLRVDEPSGFPFGPPARPIALPNGSLEDWTRDKDGRLVPLGCEYHPAPGGALEPVADAAAGRVAAVLRPSGLADSWLRCEVLDVTPLRGRYVRLSAAVRTAATYPGAIQLDVQDGVGPITFERSDTRPADASAPAGWARRAVVARVHPRADRILFTVNATFAADAPVFVDDLRIEVAEASPPQRRIYREDFPFARTPVDALPAGRTAWVLDAFAAADALRAKPSAGGARRQRAFVPDDVLRLTPGEQYYRFLPAYSRTLNTAPLYSSEIPAGLARLFRDLPERRAGTRPMRPAHPDMPPLLTAFKREQLGRTNAAMPVPYPAQITILPHRRDRAVGQALLAEEGGTVPRAFLASRVVRFTDVAEEYAHLARRLGGGGTLQEEVTTSDPTFPPSLGHGAATVPGHVTFNRDEPEHVSLTVTTGQDTHVALLDLWSAGWRATVDSRPAPIYQGYGAVRVVPVPAGRHVVDFTYRVPGLPATAAVSAFAATAGLVILSRRPRRSISRQKRGLVKRSSAMLSDTLPTRELSSEKPRDDERP